MLLYVLHVFWTSYLLLTPARLLKGIVKRADPCKCDIRLVSGILWHKRIIPSLKEWRFWYLKLTGDFPLYFLPVFLTQVISRRQKNADAKVALSISRRQKWNSRRQFSKNCIFLNIQLKGVVNRLPPIKNLSDHTNKFLMG